MVLLIYLITHLKPIFSPTIIGVICMYCSVFYFLYHTEAHWEWNGQVRVLQNMYFIYFKFHWRVLYFIAYTQKSFIIKCVTRLRLSLLFGEAVEHIGSERTQLGALRGPVLGSWLCPWPGGWALHFSFLIYRVQNKFLHYRIIVKIKCNIICKTLITKTLTFTTIVTTTAIN